MSYILDALKRAERERRQGQAPTAFDDMNSAAVPEPERGALRRYLLPAVLLVAVAAAVGAGTVLLLHGSAPAPASAHPAPAIAASPPRDDSGQPAPTSTPAGGAEADARIADSAQIASLDDLTGDTDQQEAAASAATARPLPAATSTPSDAPKGVETAAARANSRRETRTPAARTDLREAPAAPALALPHEGGDASAAVPTATAFQAGAATPEAIGDEPPPPGPVAPKPRRQAAHGASPGIATPGIDAIKSLSDMPAAYRSEFPPVTIDVLAYTDDPARSFVLLGGKRYKAGDNIAEGPHIADIVPEGIIFDWRGERVLVARPH